MRFPKSKLSPLLFILLVACSVVPQGTGSISGTLIYPSEYIPPMNVVAFSTDGNSMFVSTTVLGQDAYQIDNLPPGFYYVVAYAIVENIDDFGGGYTPAVACGLSVGCDDHSLIPVQVFAGGVTTNIDPHDWYAPDNAFPANPF